MSPAAAASRTLAGVAVTCAFLPLQAEAASYPTRAIRLVVPFAAGGNVDVTARVLLPGMIERLGVPVVVDNRGGAGGHVATEVVADATPDGHTLLMGSTGLLTIAPAVNQKLKYDPTRDFTAISLVTSVPMVLVVSLICPAKTVGELIALAKSRPGELNMAISGIHSTGQLAGALFQYRSGIRFVYVPYKGGAPATNDLMGGHVDVMFDTLASALGTIRSGRIRALAVATAERAAALPEVPTMAEAGVPGVEAGNFTAILAPSRTASDIVARLNEVVVATLRSSAGQQSLARLGVRSIESTPEEAKRYIRAEIAKWTKIVRATGIKTE